MNSGENWMRSRSTCSEMCTRIERKMSEVAREEEALKSRLMDVQVNFCWQRHHRKSTRRGGGSEVGDDDKSDQMSITSSGLASLANTASRDTKLRVVYDPNHCKRCAPDEHECGLSSQRNLNRLADDFEQVLKKARVCAFDLSDFNSNYL